MTKKERFIRALDRLIEWSLYVLIFSLPISKTAIEVCATTAIVSWCIKKILLGRKGLKLAYAELNLPLIIFLFIGFVSIFFSTYSDISTKAFFRKLLEYIALYFVVLESVTKKEVVRKMIIAMGAIASVIIIDCLYQKVTGFDFIRGYRMFITNHIETEGRMTASFNFPNGLSAWLLIISLPFISLALYYKRNKHLRIISSVLAVFLVVCLFLAYTKGAIVGFILGLALLFFLKMGKRQKTLCIVFLLLATTIILLVPHELRESFNLSSISWYGTSAQHRLQLWATAWRMFMDRPLLGQGLNTFMANYERFRGPLEKGIWYAHNCYLQIAAELGIFGLLVFLWMIIRMAISSVRSWKRIDDEFLRYTYLGLFCGIAAFLMHSAVETSLYSLQLAVLFYFSLGLLMGIKRIGCSYGKV